MLFTAIIAMTLALIFYSAGVWGEKLSGGLKIWNLVMFWLGLVFDSTGTAIMSGFSNASSISLHTVTGALAILLMIFHAIWATVVLARKNEKLISTFHRFSIVVWLIWLIPYVSGVIVGMN
ncbi:MAG: TIGR03987 family protein [Spirochaetales bacterium]|nr:TIGR03987 family protein [Spirochaetales bacterium]